MAHYLRAQGFDARALAGGYDAWRRAYPVAPKSAPAKEQTLPPVAPRGAPEAQR